MAKTSRRFSRSPMGKRDMEAGSSLFQRASAEAIFIGWPSDHVLGLAVADQHDEDGANAGRR